MQLGDTLRLAFASLSARKLRTLLTLLGLIIGVTSLILVMTLIQGANGYVEARIANLGTDIFQVSKVPLATTDFQEILKARDRKSTRLNSSHSQISYAVFCLKKKKTVRVATHTSPDL